MGCMTTTLPSITMVTDGSALGNPGPGGWASILISGQTAHELQGGEKHTTNNRMEIMGLLAGLRVLNRPCHVNVIADSKYVIDSIEKGWALSWQKRGCVKSDKKPAANADLWEQVLEQLKVHSVSFTWVKGHNGHPLNERADELAQAAAQRERDALRRPKM